MAEETEELEVVVLTEEQIKAMPEETQEDIVFLTENVPTNQLVKLNPLVVNLSEIKNEAAKIKYKKPDKEGLLVKKDFDAENIKEFTECVGKVKSYRSALKSTCSELKRPQLDINKAYNAIQKVFHDEATAVLDAMEADFKDWRDFQQREKEEKEKRKNKALIEAKEQAESQASAAVEKAERMEVYNNLKFSVIGNILVETSNMVLRSNKETLQARLTLLQNGVYSDYTKDVKLDILTEEQQKELVEKYNNDVQDSIELIRKKLEAIETETKNVQLEAQKEVSSGSHNFVPPPPAPVKKDDGPQDIVMDALDEHFVEQVKSNVEYLFNTVDQRLKKIPKSSPKIYELRGLLHEILNK